MKKLLFIIACIGILPVASMQHTADFSDMSRVAFETKFIAECQKIGLDNSQIESLRIAYSKFIQQIAAKNSFAIFIIRGWCNNLALSQKKEEAIVELCFHLAGFPSHYY